MDPLANRPSDRLAWSKDERAEGEAAEVGTGESG